MKSVGSSLNIAERLEQLPPLPPIAHRVLQVTESPEASVDDVADVLRSDPLIVARVLRVANSPFYGASRQITQVTRAVTRLGRSVIRNLVLALCAQDALIPRATRTIGHAILWRHSIVAASTCELIARRTRAVAPEEAFVAGLLHDTGLLAVLSIDSSSYDSVAGDGLPDGEFMAHEQTLLGIDHAEAGFKVLTNWGIPEDLCRAVRYHHASADQLRRAKRQLLPLVALGDVLAHVLGASLDRPAGPTERVAVAADRLGLSLADLHELLPEVVRHAEKATDALCDGGEAGPVRPTDFAGGRVAWLHADAAQTPSVSLAMLRELGCDVAVVAPTDREALQMAKYAVIDAVALEAGAAPRLADAAYEAGCRRVVLLSDAPERGPVRARGEPTWQYHLPRVFTAHDFRWVEQESLR